MMGVVPLMFDTMQSLGLVAYRITCTVSGKCYIGITTGPLERRWRKHVGAASCGRKTRLAAAIRKHGPAAFFMEPVAEAITRENLLALEQQLIAQEGTHRRGYNMTAGGDGVPGLSHSAEARAKLAAAHRGRKQSPQAIAKRAAKLRGKKLQPRTAEWKAAHSAMMRGRKYGPQSDERRAKIGVANSGERNGMFGRTHTPEARAMIAEANTAASVAYLQDVKALLDLARAAGAKSYRQIADWLNAQNIPTRYGATWNVGAVYYVTKRCVEALE